MSYSSLAWQTVFNQLGLRISASGEPELASNAVASQSPLDTRHTLHACSQLGVIVVTGEDRHTFLQGQLTNDINQLSAGAQFTGYCTAKGRLLAIFYAAQHDDKIMLLCDRALVPDLIKRLRMYVLRSKVQIEDASERLLAFGVAAPDFSAPDFSASGLTTWSWPAQPHQLIASEHGLTIGLPAAAGLTRALLLVSVEQAAAVCTQLLKGLHLASSALWEALEIQAGIPQIVSATREQFVPQMVNLDALHGINFKKGCYTGQEIVARTHYLGKVKRRTLLARLPASPQAPQPGDDLLDNQQQNAGQLVRVAPDGADGWWLLAECRLEAKDAGAITWQGLPLHFEPLPYALS